MEVKVIKARYLIKCDMPGCKNISKNMFSQGDELKTTGLAICDKCIREMSAKIKNVRNINGKEIN